LTFDSNFGRNATSTREVNYGTSIGEFPYFHNVGHELTGWFTERNGGYQAYEWTTVCRNATYYARWKPKTYRIFLDAKGGKLSIPYIEVKYGESIGQLPTPSKKGNSFLGWVDQNGNNVVSGLAYAIEGNTKYRANWRETAHTATFDANGGSFGEGSIMTVSFR
jgi:hypothetical protein